MAQTDIDPVLLNVRFQQDKNRVHFENVTAEGPEFLRHRHRHRDGARRDFDLEYNGDIDTESDQEDLYNELMLEDDFMEPFNLDDLLHSLNGYPIEEVLPFQHGEKESGLCPVCIDYTTAYKRSCCSKLICDSCIKQYCIIDVQQGILKIHCPIPECQSFITKDEIVYRLPNDLKLKFNQYLTDANADPCIKTCPRCSHITKLGDRDKELHKRKVKKYGLCITCVECQLKWCFPCQAPWHEGVTCQHFRTGDRLVKDWAQTLHPGSSTKNAVKCPKCKIFIERTEGCDHMHCVKCNTDFCYRCGETYRSLKFLGNHHDRYSVFGCKYRLNPGKPNKRKLIRGAILTSKILALPCIAVVAVGAGAIILVAGAVLGPFYGAYKLHRKRMKMKKMKKRKSTEHEHRILLRGIRKSAYSGTDPPIIGPSMFMNQSGDNNEKVANFDDEYEDLEFYDVLIPIEKLQELQMRKSDLPMDFGDYLYANQSTGYSDSESDLSKWSDEYAAIDLLDLPWRDDLERPPRRGQGQDSERPHRGQGYKGSRMGRESLSSDSDLEELDSGVMFVLDSAGKVYSSDNSSLRASKDTIVEYVAAVSETTHL